MKARPILQLVILVALCAASTGFVRAAKSVEPAPAMPERGRVWSIPLSHGAQLDLMWIPAGSFAMGSPESEPGRHDDEGPQTYVTLNDGFWMGKTLVTIGEWDAIMGESLRNHLAKKISDPARYDFNGQVETLREFMDWSRSGDISKYLANEDDALPMYYISWNDAVEFSEKITQRERLAGRLPQGYIYTLPTEAQWEYACRAGTATATYLGEISPQVLNQIAWYDGNSATDYRGHGIGNTFSGPRQVGQKQANAWGLFDMSGNIWEWCRDWYGPYPGGSATDPLGPKTGSLRVNRGGSFGSGMFSERSASRAGNPPAEASAYRGFRLVLCRAP